ncbi:hypothetical protein FRC00_010553 [Tulasnella sp. 408]|nr:hypothetical protein FRC00_010553 [Tulasnella sp. 408]
MTAESDLPPEEEDRIFPDSLQQDHPPPLTNDEITGEVGNEPLETVSAGQHVATPPRGPGRKRKRGGIELLNVDPTSLGGRVLRGSRAPAAAPPNVPSTSEEPAAKIAKTEEEEVEDEGEDEEDEDEEVGKEEEVDELEVGGDESRFGQSTHQPRRANM